MGELHNMEASSALIQPKVEDEDTNFWSEDHDRLPLKQRLKVLLARSKLSDLFPDSSSEKDEISNCSSMANDNDGFVRKDGGKRDAECFPAGGFLLEGKAGSWTGEQNHGVKWRECNDQVIEANVGIPSIVPSEKVNGMGDSSHSQSIMQCLSVDTLGSGNSSLGLVGNYTCDGILQQKETQNENPTDFVDELDHVVLKERQRLLLSSQTMRLIKTSLEDTTGQLPSPAADGLSQQCAKIIKEKVSYADMEFAMVENHVRGGQKSSFFSSSNAVITALPYSIQRRSCFGHHFQGSESVKSGNMTTIEEKDRVCSLEKNFTRSSTYSGWNSLSDKNTVPNVAISKFVNVKVEPSDINETSIQKVSVAPLPIEVMNPLKTESGIPNDFDEDMLDHMLLRERMKLLPSYMACVDVHGMECSGKIVSSAADCEPIAKESPKLLRINRPRKRRKTATDSVETALEEDAPGLLQVLIQKGVSVNEIKLYGEPESDDALDDLPNEDNFTELEAIISKIFSRRDSLLKLPSLRCIKAEKASYCLACLFSLVEQARCLHFRKWPVEWGWCRDLQSFIFVFARHHRIVLERPEYGFATYFFELMDSLPINWQIKRLVTAMKLTSCSRVTLIENKALVVGEDLTEGEARVLIEYGWIPNTGLGTMLNYCDRVVHDRKTEDPSEWRSKIGKLLIDGYNGGCIVATDVPKKVAEYNFSENAHIKVETS